MEDEEKLIEKYKALENEKMHLERALNKLKTKETAKMDKVDKSHNNTAKEKQMFELLNAYRFTGISILEINDSSLTFIFDTCYKDQFYESYLLELITKENKVINHTMPYFVPCNALAQQHLPDNLHLFATAISNHVTSYVKRRQQCLETKVKFKKYFSKEMEHSAAYDFVRLDLVFDFVVLVTIILNYELECDLPGKIVVFTHNADPSLKPWCEETFSKQYMEISSKHLVDKYK